MAKLSPERLRGAFDNVRYGLLRRQSGAALRPRT